MTKSGKSIGKDFWGGGRGHDIKRGGANYEAQGGERRVIKRINTEGKTGKWKKLVMLLGKGGDKR